MEVSQNQQEIWNIRITYVKYVIGAVIGISIAFLCLWLEYKKQVSRVLLCGLQYTKLKFHCYVDWRSPDENAINLIQRH